jgi:hypothetical protein
MAEKCKKGLLMAEPTVQHDFDPLFWTELIEALPPALPLLEKLTTIGHSLQAGKKTQRNHHPIRVAINDFRARCLKCGQLFERKTNETN